MKKFKFVFYLLGMFLIVALFAMILVNISKSIDKKPVYQPNERIEQVDSLKNDSI